MSWFILAAPLHSPQFGIDYAQAVLLQQNITTIRRVRKSDNNRIARAVGATIVNRVEDLRESDVGTKCGLFHIEKLVPYVANEISGREDTRPPPIKIEGNEEYEVQEILDCRRRRNKWEYLVSWKGYGPNENSWEPKENVENAPEKINEFHNNHPTAPDPRRK